jgi:hypothetical protein
MARPSSTTLATIAAPVPTDGHSRVKPSVYFRPMAQTTSSNPAINSNNQLMSFSSEAMPALEPMPRAVAECRVATTQGRQGLCLL